MGRLKKDMMIEILQVFLGYQPTEQQITSFLSIVKTGNSEHLCLGDVAVPLKSPLMKSMEKVDTALGRYIRNHTEESHSAAFMSLQEGKFPVSKIWIDKDILYIKFERKEVMKCIFKEVAKNVLDYGKNILLSSMKVNIANDSSRESSALATSYRGHKLAFHIGEILKHAGATVELEECDQTNPMAKIRQNLPPVLLNPEMDAETTLKYTGLCPPPAPRVEPSAKIKQNLPPILLDPEMDAETTLKYTGLCPPPAPRVEPSAKIKQNLPPILLNPEMDGEPTLKYTGLCPPPAPRVEPSAKIKQNLPPKLLNPKIDGEPTSKYTGLCPPHAPRLEPSANVAGGEFERLVAAGMSKPMEEKKKEKKDIFKEILDILDPSVPLQPSKDQKKGLIEEIFDAHKDIKAIIKSSKESKTETTSYTIENVTEESYPPPCDDKIFKKYHCFYVPELGEKKMEAPLVTRKVKANLPTTKEEEKKMEAPLVTRKVKANLPTTKEEEKNEINLYIAREPLPTTMISKANQYLYAPVVHMKTSKVWNGSTEDLCKILVEELKRAAAQKHGDVDTPEWSQFLEEQAWRCMSFQMLSVSHCSPLKVEMDGVTQNSRESAFILYNYARLCTIFQSFEESVSEGEFPPLPDFDEIDFALLRNEEEWQLVWGYIFHFPDIIEENAVQIMGGTGKFRTVAVTKFMSSFSHRVSEYYSRYHVLSDPLPHLLPTMYARLHLLQAVKTVMEICFATLGVQSPTSFM